MQTSKFPLSTLMLLFPSTYHSLRNPDLWNQYLNLTVAPIPSHINFQPSNLVFKILLIYKYI